MKRKKLLALLTALVLVASLLSLPAAAANNDSATADPSKYPTILIHGFLGWGPKDNIDAIVPYFGMTSGSLVNYLNGEGYNVYAASTGPFSSAWDRACELYAQLTGTRTDYGIAHSQKYGHDRYGEDYTGKPLMGDYAWSAENPINLVGHSFGGVISRTLLDMLVDGRPEEVAAAKAAGEKVNPLFEGGKKGYIHSLTAVAAPSNGSSCPEATPDLANAVTSLGYGLTNFLELTPVKGLYDTELDQFGITADKEATMGEAIERVMYSDFAEHNDSCLGDLVIDRACDINKDLEVQPDVYYFNYYGSRMQKNPVGDGYVPTSRMFFLFNMFAIPMGQYDGYTAGYYMDGYGDYETRVDVPSQHIGEDWQDCDGLVNTISGYCPYHFNSAGEKVLDAHKDVADGTTSFEKGIWNIFPVKNFDHTGIVGGLLNENASEVQALYDEIMMNIKNSAVEGSGNEREAGCPSAAMTDVPVNAWFHSPVDNVISKGIMAGTSATTFEPKSNVTRAMLAQILYAEAGKPSGAPDAGFDDVKAGDWFADAVNWAKANGVVGGYPDNTFRPDDNITREQLAVMLKAYAGETSVKPADIRSFADAGEVSSWAADAVAWAVGAGLIAGRGNNDIAPHASATRAEVAQIMTNFVEKF